MFVYNVSPTAKVIWRRGHGLKSHSTGIEPGTPGLQGRRFIHDATAASNRKKCRSRSGKAYFSLLSYRD